MGHRLPAQPGRGGRPFSVTLLATAPEFDRDLEIAASLGRTSEEFYALSGEEQAFQIARWHRKRETCQACGHSRSECQDHEREWFPQRSVCYASMEEAAANARYDELHKDMPYHDGGFERWSKERSAKFPYHYRDGVRVWVSATDLAPWDEFLTRSSASPVRPQPDRLDPEDSGDDE